MKEYDSWIGKKVVKKSRNPFKSQKKQATVKGISINPDSNKIAFSFNEDDSLVNCEMCTLKENIS